LGHRRHCQKSWYCRLLHQIFRSLKFTFRNLRSCEIPACYWPRKPVRGPVTVFQCRFYVFQQRVSKRSQRSSIIHHSSSQQQPTNNDQPTTTNQQRPTNCDNRQPRPPPTLFVFIVPTVCCLHRPNCARTNAARRNDHHRLTMALSPCPCPANKYHPTMSFCSLVACCLTSCVPLHLDLD